MQGSEHTVWPFCQQRTVDKLVHAAAHRLELTLAVESGQELQAEEGREKTSPVRRRVQQIQNDRHIVGWGVPQKDLLPWSLSGARVLFCIQDLICHLDF